LILDEDKDDACTEGSVVHTALLEQGILHNTMRKWNTLFIETRTTTVRGEGVNVTLSGTGAHEHFQQRRLVGGGLIVSSPSAS